MKKIIENWVHNPGIHCGSVALRDVINYHGYSYSEAMCFGLGGGLGFYYTIREDTSPTRMIFLRGPEMEPFFFSLIDKPSTWKYEADDDKALEMTKEWINRDIPVLIQTDIFYLDYYNSNTHFPGHIVSVWGYDDETETVYLADTGFEGLQSVSYEKFKKGRSSKAMPNPLNNNWMEVNPRKPLKPLSELIPEAIRRNTKRMLEGYTGVRGESSLRMIKLWSDDLLNWIDVADWKWCARFGYQVIVKRGVCGAGFRWLYRDFLKEAEDIIPALREFKLSARMDVIGTKWHEIAMLLKRISETDITPELLAEASSRAKEIWELEGNLYRTAIEIP